LDAIDLGWTMKEIASKRWHMSLNEVRLAKLMKRPSLGRQLRPVGSRRFSGSTI